MLTVYIGDITEYLAFLVTKKDPTAFLCTDDNVNETISGTVYTSLGDLSLKNFYALVSKSDFIVYCPPVNWSSEILKNDTLRQLNFVSNYKKIENFNRNQCHYDFLSLADVRKSDTKQLWVVGCSYSHGFGVDIEHRYGALLGKALDLPVSFLTYPGSSISWAADQILRSDIRENDIVVWGITGAARFSFVSDDYKLNHITTANYHQNSEFKNLARENFLISNHMCYESIVSIEQVICHLDRIKAKYILGVLPLSVSDHESYMLTYLSQNKNSLMLYHDHDLIDLGNDNLHPGPAQHRWYANTILNFYYKNL